MTLGDYIKKLRNDKGYSQRDLSEKSGISDAEISRIESGNRKAPSPASLKAIASHLGVSYQDLMQKAGYIEEVIEHPGYIENIYRDKDGNLIDIFRRAKFMDQTDREWADLAYRVSSELSWRHREIIKSHTRLMLEDFLKSKEK